jgi:hypothetical protein
MESNITISLVHGGYVLVTPVESGGTKTQVFTSTAKLNKAVRAAVEQFTLVPKKANDTEAE